MMRNPSASTLFPYTTLFRSSSSRRSQFQLAPTQPLLDGMTTVCQRLAPAGWGDLLLAVSDGKLDITVDNLGDMVAQPLTRDRKSTRLNSSHVEISYAVFCLK